MNVALSGRTTAPAANAAGFLAEYDAVRASLGDHIPRDAAADWLRRNGLPRRTAEAWRYTDLRPLWEHRAAPAAADHDARTALQAQLDRFGLDAGLPRLVFVDGALSETLSRRPDRIDCGGFPGMDALAVPDHPIVALNTMLARDGVSIRVPAGLAGGTLLLVTLGRDQGQSHLRHRLLLEAGASLTLLEVAIGEGGYVNEAVLEIEVRETASLAHVRMQQESPQAVSLSHVRVQVAQRACYDGFNLALGAVLARHEVRARLEGMHGIVHVNGAQLLSGSQIADLTSAIVHAAPHCSSRQTVKNVLAERSRGVFQGKIVVDRVAQKTDGYQMNQALLLSPDAEIDSKPELEIFADDVKCSHGATAGALDEEQLFYMRSRGVPAAAARAILVRAFLDDALALVTDEAARAVLERAVDRRWDVTV